MQVKGFVFTDMDKYMKVYEDKKNYNYAVLSTTYPFIISKNKATKIYTIQDPKNILNSDEWVKFTKTLQTFCAAPLTKPAVGFTL